MEYYENRDGAVAKLLWSSAGQTKQVIPKEQLFNDFDGDQCPTDPNQTEPGECCWGKPEDSCSDDSAIDATTLDGKIMAGYQGWFNADGDGAGYGWWNASNEWKNVFMKFYVISPWAVGRYGSNGGADDFRRNIIVPDLNALNGTGIDYLPVVFPNFSWVNLKGEKFKALSEFLNRKPVAHGRDKKKITCSRGGRRPSQGARPVMLNCPRGLTYDWTSLLPFLNFVQQAGLRTQKVETALLDDASSPTRASMCPLRKTLQRGSLS